MIVCHCHCVTDRSIREAVRAGASTVRAVGAACGAGTGCGGCRELVELIVEKEQAGGRPQVSSRIFEATADAT
jgi:bacterioferritin-associated ferredoxin